MPLDLHIPFHLQPDHKLSSGTTTTTILNNQTGITLESKGSRCNIRISGLEAPEDAQAWMPQAFTGLVAFMLETRSSFTASWNLAPAFPVRKPLRPGLPSPLQDLDVLGDEDRPFVVEAGQRVGFFEGHAPTLVTMTSLERAVKAIATGMEALNAKALFHDQRFRTAVELLASVGFEESLNARLLTAAMALEVLAPSTERHAAAVSVLDGWEVEIASLIAKAQASSDEYEALESLRREIFTRKTASIRSRIRSLVMMTLSDHPDVKRLALAAVRGYDARSTLVHKGSIATDKALTALGSLRNAAELVISVQLFGRHTGTAVDSLS